MKLAAPRPCKRPLMISNTLSSRAQTVEPLPVVRVQRGGFVRGV